MKSNVQYLVEGELEFRKVNVTWCNDGIHNVFVKVLPVQTTRHLSTLVSRVRNRTK